MCVFQYANFGTTGGSFPASMISWCFIVLLFLKVRAEEAGQAKYICVYKRSIIDWFIKDVSPCKVLFIYLKQTSNRLVGGMWWFGGLSITFYMIATYKSHNEYRRYSYNINSNTANEDISRTMPGRKNCPTNLFKATTDVWTETYC